MGVPAPSVTRCTHRTGRRHRAGVNECRREAEVFGNGALLVQARARSMGGRELRQRSNGSHKNATNPHRYRCSAPGQIATMRGSWCPRLRRGPQFAGHSRTMTVPTVLVVDDVPENLTVLGELLVRDYTVRAANSGPAALRLAATHPLPDLILLDLMMPGMDGYEVMQHLRDDAATRDIPVICVTALNATEEEERGLSMGAVDYITKPLRPPVVLARVRTQIELKRARDKLSNQNAFLEAEVARRMRENQQAHDASIHALARLAETRDPE